MTHINKITFSTVIIDGTNRELNILSFAKENYAIYFSTQSVAQCINELLNEYGANEIFHTNFAIKWTELKFLCFTEFQIRLLTPINLIIEPSTEFANPFPVVLTNARYLNDAYKATIENYADYTALVNDVFCIAEQRDLLVTSTHGYVHQFINSIAFLSFIPILKLRYLRKMYTTFFRMDLMNSDDIEYIYETLVLNRTRINPDTLANVFQLTPDMVHFQPRDLDDNGRQLFVAQFNRACRVMKSFAFNLFSEQSMYIAKNLQIVQQFGLDRMAIEEAFRAMPKLRQSDDGYTQRQIELLCMEQPAQNINVAELLILQSLIRIHLMIQRMTAVYINKEDLAFYQRILRTRFSSDLNELIFDDTCTNRNQNDDYLTISYETIDGKRTMVKNYTIGEIIGEFVRLYARAQQYPDTLWLCKFIEIICNPCYANLVNVMADFVPFFQRFFTNDFNINSINNMVIFMQGMCKPDENKLKTLKDFRDLRQMDVRVYKTFSLVRYKAINTNPLITFMDLVLLNKNKNFLINLNTMTEPQRNMLVNLIDPKEQDFINYIYEMVIAKGDKDNGLDLTGDRRFNLQNIDYEKLVPKVSTNTFNENNTTNAAMTLFTTISDQTLFFHELTNRCIYKIPEIVAKLNIK